MKPTLRAKRNERVIDIREGNRRPARRRPSGRNENRRPRDRDDIGSEKKAQLRESRFFGSPAFRRLWFSQAFSSLGDWMGFFATTAIAARLGGPGGAAGAISLTLAARMVPGFLLSPFAGVVVDRYNRKSIMVVCDLGRAIVFCALPFVHALWQLFLASLLLEIFTLLWSPAKEASVPKLVKKSFLPTANSLSLAAAYGPAPFAPAIFALFAKAPEWLGQSELLRELNLKQETLALYADALTYIISAAVIATLAIPHTPRPSTVEAGRQKLYAGYREAREGLAYITRNRRIRAVVFGLATGLIGGGMIVPLGTLFASEVLHAGNGGYGLLLTGMGAGVAIGMLIVSVLQKRLNMEKWFAVSLLGAGVSLIVASLMHSLTLAVILVGVMGMFAGCVYVLAFSSAQANSDDEIRGRVFVSIYTLTRVCIMLAFVLAPLLSETFLAIARTAFGDPPILPGLKLHLFGVRMTFWAAGLIILASGVFALRSLRADREDGSTLHVVSSPKDASAT